MSEGRAGAGGDAAWIAAWTAAGLVLRAMLIGFTNRITGDGVGWYIPMARAFVEGRPDKGFDAYIPPVYSLSTAAVAKLLPAAAWAGPAGDAGALELAGQITSALYGAATIPLAVLLVRRLAPSALARPAARIAAPLAAITPWLARYGARVMTESAYTFFFAIAILAGLVLLARRSAIAAAAFGLAVGVGCLNRPEAMGLLAVFGGWIGLPALWQRRGVARALGLGGVVAIFFLAGTFPQMAITHAKLGVWTLSAKGGVNFLSAHTKDPLVRERVLHPLPKPRGGAAKEGHKQKESKVMPFSLAGYLLRHPGGFARDFVSTLADLAVHVPVVIGIALSAFGLAGIFLRRGVPWTEGERVAASVPLTYLLAFSLFRAETRFLVPLVPVCLLWPSLGVLEVSRQIREGRLRRIASALPEGARRRPEAWVLAAALILTLPEALDPVRQGGFRWYWSPEKEVGVWMRRHLPPEPKIMTRGSYIETYYAGARVAYFPFGPYDEVKRYVRRTEVGYILIDEKTRRLRPGFTERLAADREARLLRKFDLGKDTEYLYEVLPAEIQRRHGDETSTPDPSRAATA